MKRHQLVWFALLLMGLQQGSFRLQAQSTEGHDAYLHHSYQEAIRKYRAQVDKHPDDGLLLFNLADSYRLNGQMKEAENWFAQALQHSDDSRARLYYAQVLLCNRKYADAKAAFLNYAGQAPSEADARNAQKLAATCDKLATDGPQQTAIHVQKADFNSDQLDFSPTYWKPGTLVFASNRPGTTGPEDAPDPWTEDPFVDLWVVDIAPNGKTGTPMPLSKAINSRYHEGPMTFSKNGSSMYLTRSDLKGNTQRGYDDRNNTRLKIYSAVWLDAQWVVGEELPFNDSKFSTCHPALSPTEDTLVFSSDRPGGFGGMDLWYVVRDGKGWSAPTNLGQDINTAGNEVFPFLQADGSLDYSSDLMAGMGGLDIFHAAKNVEGWGMPENLGAPINSSLDDFGISMAEDGKHGHFSSNRSGKGDDVYAFLDRSSLKIAVLLLDCASGKPLQGLNILVEAAGNRVFTTDDSGRVQIPAIPGADYQLRAYGAGYYATASCEAAANVHIPSKGNELLPEVVLRLSKRNPCCFALADPDQNGGSSHLQYQWKTGDGHTLPGRNVNFCYEKDGIYQAQLDIVDADLNGSFTKSHQTITVQGCDDQTTPPLIVEGVIRDKALGTPLPMTEVALVDKCTGKTTTAMSDSTGHYQFVMPGIHECDHWLMAKKTGFIPQNIALPIKGRDNTLPLRQDVALDREGQGPQNQQYAGAQPLMGGQMLPPAPAGYIYVVPINAQAALFPGAAPSEAQFSKPLDRGDVIELFNIYFDFGKFSIRPDAETDLLFLLTLLRKYPNMQGEISAHTDCRASETYNMHLSHQRALAARNWLVARGVAPQRLLARGFGEYQLRNGCSDNSFCSELEHQRNRRVEFKVTHFDGVINSKEYEYFLPRELNASK
jgi:outer membrane protein OmpA-like peptidoglycan-associated protein